MKAQDFEALKDHLLLKNKYFSCGYANAFKDEKTDKVAVVDGNRFVYLMPDDSLGNYFYLRNEATMSHGFLRKTADCAGDVYTDTLTAYLVAVVKEAEPFALIENLRNTLASYKGLGLQVTQSMWNRESVVIGEMKGAEEDEVLKALARLKNETIVKITVQISMEFATSNCINEICKNC